MQADRPPSTSDYQAEFLSLLNNNFAPTPGGEGVTKIRDRGFVVIVRGATSLTPLQTLCFEQTSKVCLTARYRLQPSAPLGTLLIAFVADLLKSKRSEKGIAGDFKPDCFQDKWQVLGSKLFVRRMDESSDLIPLVQTKQGLVNQAQLARVLEVFKSPSILGPGDRLVLFGEIAEEVADASEWQAAKETLFTQLPERVGLVFSGAPKDLALSEDPHYLEITLPKVHDVVADAHASSVYTFTDSSFHTDEPATQDQLGVNEYANAVARFLVHPQTMAPLTLGINGPWGKGKSSFMNLIKRALIKYANVNRNVAQPDLNGETRTQRWNDLAAKIGSPFLSAKAEVSYEELQKQINENLEAEKKLWKEMEVEAQKNVLSVTFNAWQFEDAKQTWAGLASQISETIEKSLPWISRQALKLSYAWSERRSELILTLLLPVAIILIVAGLVWAGFFANVNMPNTDGLALILPGSALLTIWFISSQFLKIAVPISERVLSYTRMPNYREQMGFQHRVKDDLEFIRTFLTKQKNRRDCRVIVYIDDLDRCSENKIMEHLQAINLVLGSSKFFVVLGMDTKMIHRAIKAHYKECSAEFPDSYLRKIVQISLYLPGTQSGMLADYLNSLFSVDARMGLRNQANGKIREKRPEQSAVASAASELRYNLENVLTIIPIVTKEAEDTADELQAFRDYCNYLDDNPREIKRLINIHRMIKILVQKPNTSWSGDRQRKLVKWLIFCDRWPHLVDDVLEQKDRPEFLDIFRDLVASLAEEEKNNKGTDSPTPFYGLAEFAEYPGEAAKAGPDGKTTPLDPLLFRDIDVEFRLAANLSQLISRSPAKML